MRINLDRQLCKLAQGFFLAPLQFGLALEMHHKFHPGSLLTHLKSTDLGVLMQKSKGLSIVQHYKVVENYQSIGQLLSIALHHYL